MVKLKAETFWKLAIEYMLTKRILNNRIKKIILLYLVIISFLIISCKEKREDVLVWLNRYPIEKSGNTMSEQITFLYINKKYRNMYIEKLNNKKYIILNNDEYFLLTGQILKKNYGLAVRGIGSHPSEVFTLYRNYNNEIYILSYMTDDFKYIKKTVLIIEVDEIPKDIFNNLPTENMVRKISGI